MSQVTPMQSKEVFDVESGEGISSTAVKSKPSQKYVAEDELKLFKDQIKAMCETLNKVNDRLSATKSVEGVDIQPETVWDRIKDNTLRDMFVGMEVSSEDVDNVVNTLTLMNALILTIPYGLLSAANHDYWDWIQDTLSNCATSGKVIGKYHTFDENFTFFSNSFNAVVYSTISVLLMAMVYYLLRPKSDEKFRKWWKSARYVIIVMLVGTVCSCVSLIAISSWMFSWYTMPTSEYCNYSAKGSYFTGISIIVVTFLLSAFLML